MLNGQQLSDSLQIFVLDKNGVNTKVDDENIQQHGIDLNIISIDKVIDGGIVTKRGKTIPAKLEKISPQNGVYFLLPEIYDITFKQGCEIKDTSMFLIRQRSSMARCGSFITSNVYDAGFKTDNIGAILTVHLPITIEEGARVALIYEHVANKVDNVYDGQWQNDKQRNVNNNK